ncbi:hypothetical protein [Noviherbaspirillum autotrophicum]|uniref:hypothetical protein n=1 Tax=Noviherbaspirillum autotrophicum TaxID=709839 RepID=UPI0012FDDBCF|nr:hypothetical protein [Noviherbaspirillum autotrophicum]
MSKKADMKPTEADSSVKMNGADKAKLALIPSVNAASVMLAYPNDIVGADVELATLLDGLRDSCNAVKDGDLTSLEAMLAAQAIALQSIFTSLARRAQTQEYQRQLEALLTLALKAQSQSRATILALAELKYPRQVAFVNQANISHGPQQVNNGGVPSSARARKKQTTQNKLLEDQTNGRTHLDGGATAKTGGRNAALETVGKIHRSEKRGRKSKGGA